MILDAGVLILAALYVGLPVLAVVIAGLSGSLGVGPRRLEHLARRDHRHRGLHGRDRCWRVSGALVLILGRRPASAAAGVVSFIGSLPLAFSPLALGAGLFVLLLRLGAPLDIGLGLVALINGFMGIALCRARRGAGGGARPLQRHDRLCGEPRASRAGTAGG